MIYIPDDISYHGRQVKHIRTGNIRTIYVLQGVQTPSSEGILGKYNPLHNILYDTFMLNNQFYITIN